MIIFFVYVLISLLQIEKKPEILKQVWLMDRIN